MESRLLLGAQDKFFNILKVPPVADVSTANGYLHLVLKEQAVTCSQHLFTKGYTVVVSAPMPIATGMFIVAVSGMLCTITKQPR